MTRFLKNIESKLPSKRQQIISEVCEILTEKQIYLKLLPDIIMYRKVSTNKIITFFCSKSYKKIMNTEIIDNYIIDQTIYF